jgi:hypothetical protein
VAKTLSHIRKGAETVKQVQRLIVNRVIDGVLVVALENVPGRRATQVRVAGGTEPMPASAFRDPFFCPGRIERDVDRANALGEEAMALYRAGQLEEKP